jgi:hypothetical protein
VLDELRPRDLRTIRRRYQSLDVSIGDALGAVVF